MPNYVPDSNQIKTIMKLVERSPEGADYFCQRLETTFKNAVVLDKPVFQSMLDRVKSFRDQVVYNSELGADAWAAENISATLYQNYLQHSAELAVNEVSHQLTGDLGVEVAVGKGGEILRGYTDGGKPIVDPDLRDSLDKAFNAWLATNEIKTKDGILYKATIDGVIRQKEGGGEMVADAKKVQELIMDARDGLQNYFVEKQHIPTKDVVLLDYDTVVNSRATEPEKPTPTSSSTNH